MKLSLKVIPGSSQDCIVGWLGEALKIKVKAQPENGKANKAVICLLAKSLKISNNDINIISGPTQGNKVVEIQGEATTLMNLLPTKNAN